ALDEVPGEVEHIDEAVARPRHVVCHAPVLLGVGDEELAADILDAEGGKTDQVGGGVGVGEGAEGAHPQGDGVEVGVEDVDGAAAEVGGVEEASAGGGGDRQPLVDRAGCDVGGGQLEYGRVAAVPTGDGAV